MDLVRSITVKLSPVGIGSLVFLFVVVVVVASTGRLPSMKSVEARSGQIGAVLADTPLGKVLHVTAVVRSVDAQGASLSKQHEMWLDPRTRDTLYTVMNVDGTERITHVRHGRMISRYHSDTDRVITSIATSDDELFLDTGIRLLLPRRAWEQGWASGHNVEFEGQPAVQIQPIEPDSEGVSHRYWVSKETLLPLKEQVVRVKPSGDEVEVGTSIWSYQTVEHVDRSELPVSLFELQVADTVTEARSTYMSLAQAHDFNSFEVYFAGDTFDGLPIFAIVYREGLGPGYEHANSGLPMVLFDVTYAEPFDRSDRRTDKLSVVQMPVNDGCPPRKYPSRADVLPLDVLDIGGVQASLYEHGPNGRVDLQMQRGNTCIIIYARDRDRVLMAARSLRPLN